MKSFLLRTFLLVMLVIGIGWNNASAAENTNPNFQEINRLLTAAAIENGIPPEVLKAVAWEESGWRQFVNGKPYVSSDGGIGIMQITNKPEYNQTSLKNDIAYNIQAGAKTLASMYKRGDLPKIKGASSSVIENWYFPVMAYNGTKPANSPLYKATGAVNSEAYQEKVFQDLRDHLLAGRTLGRYPFTVNDFEYDSTTTKNIVFKKKLYTLSTVITTSHAGFSVNSKAVTTDSVKLRKTPGTSVKELKTLSKGTVLTITGNFVYDETKTSKNQFVWYPVKTNSGEKGYVSSGYLAKSIFTVNKVTDQSTAVTGNVAKGYSITVTGSDKVKSRGISAANENYSLKISSKLKQGTKLTFLLKDGQGLIHEKRTITVTDGTKPAVPKVNTIDDNDTVITGTAEKGSRVYAYVSGKSIGNAKANSSTGKYSIAISKKKAGTKVVLKARDAAGNYSAGKIMTVIDKTPPNTPKANTIDDNDTVITGTAEKGSRVYAYVSGKSIGNAKANSSTGKYSIAISKKKAGTKIVLKARDAAGNYSSGKTMTVIDKTPPAAPKVNKVTSKTTKVTGTAEKNATVKIYRGSTLLKTATVNSKGSYTLAIKAQKKGTALSVYAYDKAKNKSKATKVTVK
ncbi:Ig-like domain-containing protein [Bacillus sp. FJAT-27916]|uniref:Ig-like domain-containing protein n=1 Tax=Bacillus sp. FJAT-27916 TaxID=1679169 RepID=UPI00069F0F73|nr:Ig-like domain-containing protein [Bacillus sp. FJAT-27916]